MTVIDLGNFTVNMSNDLCKIAVGSLVGQVWLAKELFALTLCGFSIYFSAQFAIGYCKKKGWIK